MTDETSFWGDVVDDDAASSERSPLDLLKQAATELKQKTKQRIVPDVQTIAPSDSEGMFRTLFHLVVPLMGGYRVTLLDLRYPLGYFPMKIESVATGRMIEVTGMDSFEVVLSKVLSSPGVRDVVRKLMSHLNTE
jgi:hypothetical protein